MKKYAKAIKDGRLTDDSLFCRKDEVYTYTDCKDGRYPIHIKDLVLNHKMGYEFFDRYFIDIIDDEFLDEKEFEI